MNWEAIGAVGEIIEAAAIIVTLIFLSVQVRQSTRAANESRNATVSQLYQFRASVLMYDMLRRAESSSLSAFEVVNKLFTQGITQLATKG